MRLPLYREPHPVFSFIIVIVIMSDFAQSSTLIGYEPEIWLKSLTVDVKVNTTTTIAGNVTRALKLTTKTGSPRSFLVT